jgi:MFS transporter, FSR family, fosmidomycin resistance protein
MRLTHFLRFGVDPNFSSVTFTCISLTNMIVYKIHNFIWISMFSKTLNSSKIFIVVALMCLGHCVVDFMLGIWPVYKLMANLDLGKAGLIAGLGAFLGEGSQMIFGSLSDRGYRKQILIFGLLSTTCCLLIMFFQNYFIFFFLYLMTCMGSGAFHPPAAGIVSQILPARRGLLMTLFTAAGAIGLGSSQLVFTRVFHWFNGNAYILVIPTFLVALAIFIYKFPLFQNTAPGQHPRLRDFGEFFKRLDLRSLYVVQLANQTILWGVIFMLPNLLMTMGCPDWICLGTGHSCLVLGSASMMILGGFLADKYSSRIVLLGSTIGSFSLFYSLLFIPGLSNLTLLIILASLGAFLGVVNPVAIAFGNRLVPERPGMISAFLMGMVWCIAEVLGPAGSGLLSSLFTEGGPIKALAIIGVFFIPGIYAAYLLPVEDSQAQVVSPQ